MLKEEGSYMKQHVMHKLDNAASVIDMDAPADDPASPKQIHSGPSNICIHASRPNLQSDTCGLAQIKVFHAKP
jgi:hypothetical protein